MNVDRAQGDCKSTRDRWSAQQSTNNQCDHLPCVLAGGGIVDNGDGSIRFKRVPDEQDGKVCAANVRNELI